MIETSQPIVPITHIHITNFPMPPSANAIWRQARRRTILSDAAKAYKDEVRKWNMSMMREMIRAREAIRNALAENPKARFRCDTIFRFEPKKILCKDGTVKRNDTSNRVKALHDALGYVLNVDDKYFWCGYYDKECCNDGERESVTVRITSV